MSNDELVHTINTQFQTEIPPVVSTQELFKMLSAIIDHLIQTDVPKLLYVLYKIDVSEKKVRKMLKENPVDAAATIARLIIEREQEKILSRSRSINKKDIPEEEKW